MSNWSGSGQRSQKEDPSEYFLDKRLTSSARSKPSQQPELNYQLVGLIGTSSTIQATTVYFPPSTDSLLWSTTVPGKEDQSSKTDSFLIEKWF